MDSIPKLMDKVKQIQDKQGYPDGEMAEILGCSRQLYQMTRTGKAQLGTKILKGIIKAFPELEGDAIYFLTNSAKGLTKTATHYRITSQPSQDGKIRALGNKAIHFLRSLFSRS